MAGSGGGTPAFLHASTRSNRTFSHAWRCAAGRIESESGEPNVENTYECSANTSSCIPCASQTPSQPQARRAAYYPTSTSPTPCGSVSLAFPFY